MFLISLFSFRIFQNGVKFYSSNRLHNIEALSNSNKIGQFDSKPKFIPQNDPIDENESIISIEDKTYFAEYDHSEYDNEKIIIYHCTFEEGFSPFEGGVASVYNCELQITNSRFLLNIAHIGGALYLLQSKCLVMNSAFLYNRVSTYGGAIVADEGEMILISSRFVENHANNATGACCFSHLSLHLTRCAFISNTAPSIFSLFISQSEVRMIQCDFSSNIGSSFLYNSVVFELGQSFTLVEQCRFTHKMSITEQYDTITSKSTLLSENLLPFVSILGDGSIQFSSCTFSQSQNDSILVLPDSSANVVVTNFICDPNLQIDPEESVDKVFDHKFLMKFEKAASWRYFLILIIGTPFLCVFVSIYLLIISKNVLF